MTPPLQGNPEFHSRPGNAMMMRWAGTPVREMWSRAGFLPQFYPLSCLCVRGLECVTTDTWHVTRHICRDKEGNKCQRNQEHPGSEQSPPTFTRRKSQRIYWNIRFLVVGKPWMYVYIMDAQVGLKTIALKLFLNLFFYFLPTAALCHDFLLVDSIKT